MTLSIKSPEEITKDAVMAVEKGFKALKMKVGVNAAEDFKCVKSVREAVGNEIELRVDANQGWSVEQAVDVLNRIAEFNIQFVEEPIHVKEIDDIRRVKKNSPIPIMLDESIHSPKDALCFIKEEAMDLANIKLMKCGGILETRKIAMIAEAAGIPCMMGCMGESEIGISAATHLAAAVRNIKYADLDSDLFTKNKLVKNGGVGLKD